VSGVGSLALALVGELFFVSFWFNGIVFSFPLRIIARLLCDFDVVGGLL